MKLTRVKGRRQLAALAFVKTNAPFYYQAFKIITAWFATAHIYYNIKNLIIKQNSGVLIFIHSSILVVINSNSRSNNNNDNIGAMEL